MGVKISKTEQLIYDSFYKLRKNNPINKIKVTDVCDSANINSNTYILVLYVNKKIER